MVTKDRLLEAAGEVFAEKGFRSATVRDISRRAKANIAAINYHFGSKEKLYSSALTSWHEFIQKNYPVDQGLGDNPAGREKLDVFIRALVRRSFAGGRPSWHNKLFAREMVEQTGVLDNMLEKEFGSLFRYLREIIVQISGRNKEELEVNLCVTSILGQCFFFMHPKMVVFRVCPELKGGETKIERVADHIIRFSLAGIEAIGQKE